MCASSTLLSLLMDEALLLQREREGEKEKERAREGELDGEKHREKEIDKKKGREF